MDTRARILGSSSAHKRASNRFIPNHTFSWQRQNLRASLCLHIFYVGRNGTRLFLSRIPLHSLHLRCNTQRIEPYFGAPTILAYCLHRSICDVKQHTLKASARSCRFVAQASVPLVHSPATRAHGAAPAEHERPRPCSVDADAATSTSVKVKNEAKAEIEVEINVGIEIAAKGEISVVGLSVSVSARGGKLGRWSLHAYLIHCCISSNFALEEVEQHAATACGLHGLRHVMGGVPILAAVPAWLQTRSLPSVREPLGLSHVQPVHIRCDGQW